MKKTIVLSIVLVIAGVFLLHRESKLPGSGARVDPSILPQHPNADDSDHGPATPAPDALTMAKPSSDSPPPSEPTSKFVRPKDEPPPAPQELSMRSAPRIAWESAPKDWNEFLELDHLSANRPPPTVNETKRFRGFISGAPRDKYIEMRFERGKWIVLEGESPDQLVPRPGRDVIPFRDQPDQWTLYYDNSERLFLKHFSKLNIPELHGDFEILSGWLMDQTQIWFVAMVGLDEGWPSLELISQLTPRKPDH